ncbi:Hypothetical predicted protein [Pelobates cultripes]|uniref:Uncharacterized protein n=1 Tax=Pelobates cultripes TaxID=61616 RepID=A0AAD1RHD3_PELCU|nr:Hypothetical predicted protein [Pelobates cultripes]
MQTPVLKPTVLAEGDTQTQATKQDIHNLLQHIEKFLVANLEMVKFDIYVMTTRLQAHEEDIIHLRQELSTTRESLQQVPDYILNYLYPGGGLMGKHYNMRHTELHQHTDELPQTPHHFSFAIYTGKKKCSMGFIA